jgi:hypothetical protein
MAAVVLGALATYAIFAATTITNVPEDGTVVTGDMGIFPGTAYTGFPPGVATGLMLQAGDEAGDVKGVAQVAYDFAADQEATTTMSNIDLAGKTLTPGVYKFDAAAALSASQLYFDAQGEADAVWVFQVGSDLNIASYTKMSFVSGLGNANNVIWQVGSSATLNTACEFIGNTFAHSSISLGDGASVDGRLVALGGKVSLINNAVTTPATESNGE